MTSTAQLDLLRGFVEICKAQPSILHKPEMSFFRQWLESMGGTVPSAGPEKKCPEPKTPDEPAPPIPEPEIETDPESDVELDNTGVIEKEEVCESIPMGDPDIEVTEEMSDESSELRSQAMNAMSDGNHDQSLKLFGQAIQKNPCSAILHAKRASLLIKMNKPITAIRDCDKAIQLNPDSATGYKFRGRAHRLVGNWNEAHKDLSTACKIDYDEQTNQWLKEVTPNAKKIQEHKRKTERKREEKEIKEKLKARKARQEEYERQKAAQADESEDDEEMGEMPGMGGMPPGLAALFQDPDILKELQDPEVATAFAEIQSNPANMMKHASNPKVMKIMQKIQQKMGGGMGAGMGGGMGGFPGDMGGGFPGAGAGVPQEPEPSAGDGAPPPTAKPSDLDID